MDGPLPFENMAHFVCLRMVCVSRSVTPTFDLLTLKIGVRVAPNVRNLPSKFEHARLLVLELFAMYATDGRTKATLIVPFPTGGSIKIQTFEYSIGHYVFGMPTSEVNTTLIIAIMSAFVKRMSNRGAPSSF